VTTRQSVWHFPNQVFLNSTNSGYDSQNTTTTEATDGDDWRRRRQHLAARNDAVNARILMTTSSQIPNPRPN